MATTTTIAPETKVGAIATEYPLATRVFARHQIDFCCGGGQPLSSVCAKKGLDTATIVAEIEKEIAAAPADATRWDVEPLDALIDHILRTHHAFLVEEMPRLEAMARKVNEVHGHKMPEVFPALLNTYLGLKAELEQHMMKEEQILFPMIQMGQGSMAMGPVSVMEQEHENAGCALARLRELTNGYVAADGACNTWRALWAGLEALEADLHVHIHLENNILFPRALAGG